MADTVSNEFLAEQQRRILDEQRLFRDELNVQGAMLRRMDAKLTVLDPLLEEMRAIHRLLANLTDRIRRIDGNDQK